MGFESGRRGSGSSSVGVRCNSDKLGGLAGIENEGVERTRRQVFDDGFVLFPQMWSKEEVAAAAEGDLVVGRAQEEILKSFLVGPVGVHSQRQWLHAPGYRCTDAATSPEPYWHHSWQTSGMESEDLQLPQMPTWSAALIVSLSDRNAKMFCGGVAVFPRSHWIIQDWIASPSGQSPFPQPFDVPAAVPTELRLECGDAALLNPLLAYTITPNVSSIPAQFLIFNLGDVKSNQGKLRIDEGEQMWRGWLSMTQFLMDQTLSVEEEMVQLQIEEEKAQLGGWQGTTTGLTTDLSSFSSTRIAPRDLLAWRLRTSAVQFMRDGQWSSALSVLLRLSGLRPTCYWIALQAGQCCMKSAPAGQLGGRAGRKCTLEDGERILERAIQIAPGWPLAYVELIKCLALMGRGREQEIPVVTKIMKERCKLEQLCLRYPTVSDQLRESWNECEEVCNTAGERV